MIEITSSQSEFYAKFSPSSLFLFISFFSALFSQTTLSIHVNICLIFFEPEDVRHSIRYKIYSIFLSHYCENKNHRNWISVVIIARQISFKHIWNCKQCGWVDICMNEHDLAYSKIAWQQNSIYTVVCKAFLLCSTKKNQTKTFTCFLSISVNRQSRYIHQHESKKTVMMDWTISVLCYFHQPFLSDVQGNF